MNGPREHGPDGRVGTGHEGRGVDFRLVGGSALGLVVVTAILCFALKLQFQALQARSQRQRDAAAIRDPMAVEATRSDVDQRIERIEGPPLEGLAPIASPDPWAYSGPRQPRSGRERERRSSFAWVDREKGIVQVPVDEAMRLMLEQGRFPTRKQQR